MTTTFNTMLPSALPRARARSPIIAALSLALLLALTGCSMLKIGYSQASTLVFRWLDGYVDFDDAQADRVRAALDEAMAWHRRSQLPDYVDLWFAPRPRSSATPRRSACAPGGASCAPASIRCRSIWRRRSPRSRSRSRRRRSPTSRSATPAATTTGATSTGSAIRRNASRRRVQREIERAENFYGRLDGPQRELVARAVAASPFDPEVAFAERQWRQQEVVALARRLREGGISRDDAVAQVRGYLQRLDHSPRDGYRAYAEHLAAHNCSFASDLHNATTPLSGARRR